jgi:hypothetical protein
VEVHLSGTILRHPLRSWRDACITGLRSPHPRSASHRVFPRVEMPSSSAERRVSLPPIARFDNSLPSLCLLNPTQGNDPRLTCLSSRTAAQSSSPDATRPRSSQPLPSVVRSLPTQAIRPIALGLLYGGAPLRPQPPQTSPGGISTMVARGRGAAVVIGTHSDLQNADLATPYSSSMARR